MSRPVSNTHERKMTNKRVRQLSLASYLRNASQDPEQEQRTLELKQCIESQQGQTWLHCGLSSHPWWLQHIWMLIFVSANLFPMLSPMICLEKQQMLTWNPWIPNSHDQEPHELKQLTSATSPLWSFWWKQQNTSLYVVSLFNPQFNSIWLYFWPLCTSKL